MIGTTPRVIQVPKGAVLLFIRVNKEMSCQEFKLFIQNRLK